MAPDRDGARMTAWGRLPPVRSGVSERPESAQSRQGEPSIRTSASSLIAVTDRIAQGLLHPWATYFGQTSGSAYIGPDGAKHR